MHCNSDRNDNGIQAYTNCKRKIAYAYSHIYTHILYTQKNHTRTQASYANAMIRTT